MHLKFFDLVELYAILEEQAFISCSFVILFTFLKVIYIQGIMTKLIQERPQLWN